LTVEGTLLGVSTEEEPTAAQINVLSKAIRDKALPTIFAELTADDRVLKTVADEAGVTISEQVLLADGLGPEGTPEGTYTGMLIYNTCAIVDGLGGKCAPAP
jgi:ABC-type Zn uptake system ZnuABC Zn-binding protein ZnuA